MGDSSNFANNIWSESTGGTDLDATLAESGGITMSTDEALRSGSGTDEGTKDIGELGGIGGGTSDVGEVAVKVVASVQSAGGEDMSEFEGDKGTMKKTVRKYQGQLKYCYEQRLKENPSIGGRIGINVDIANGRVTNVTISENQTGDKAIEGCIKGKVRRWRFSSEVTESIFLPFALSAS